MKFYNVFVMHSVGVNVSGQIASVIAGALILEIGSVIRCDRAKKNVVKCLKIIDFYIIKYYNLVAKKQFIGEGLWRYF